MAAPLEFVLVSILWHTLHLYVPMVINVLISSHVLMLLLMFFSHPLQHAWAGASGILDCTGKRYAALSKLFPSPLLNLRAVENTATWRPGVRRTKHPPRVRYQIPNLRRVLLAVKLNPASFSDTISIVSIILDT